MTRQVFSTDLIADAVAQALGVIDADPDLKSTPLLDRLDRLAGNRIPARLMCRLAYRLEGGDYRSRTLRRILARQGTIAGAHSYGGLLQPGSSQGLLRIGRYASTAWNVRWGINHPLDFMSLSPMFYLPQFGLAKAEDHPVPTLEIGHDAWIAEYVVITSKCKRIGIGAVIGAGSVVTQDIPDFAIAVGAPARIVRYRFDETLQAALLASHWWRLSPEQLFGFKDILMRALNDPGDREALAAIGAMAGLVVHPQAGLGD
jgi:virginiamycin A acetyltransferase